MLAYDLIRKDIEIFDVVTNKKYSSTEITKYTDYLKNILYKKCNAKTLGKIVYIDTNNFFVVVCAMKATWELGASIFLNDVDSKVKSLPYFKNFYKFIDIVIGPSTDSTKWLQPHHIYVSTDNLNQVLASPTHYESIATQPVTPDTICYYTTSSGTTADPKILPFTHYQTVTISNEIKKYLDLDHNAKPYHYKTLHHGSLFNSYALPLLNSCQTHYSGLFVKNDELQLLTSFANCISQHSLTHFLIPYHYLREFSKIPSIDFNDAVTLITIIGNNKEDMIDLFKRFRPKQVVNYFGTSEVGTMFISRTTKDNFNDYQQNCFTDVTSFIDYEILQNKVKVKWKHVADWYETSDVMTEQNNVICYHGRDLYFQCGKKQISLMHLDQTSLHGLVAKFLDSYNFILVPDHQLEKLYLNLYDRELTASEADRLNTQIANQFGEEFVFADIFNFKVEDLKFGMKVNGPLLLYLFRERNK